MCGKLEDKWGGVVKSERGEMVVIEKMSGKRKCRKKKRLMM